MKYTPPLFASDNRYRLFLLGLTLLLSYVCLPSGPFSWLSFVLLVPLGLALRGLTPYSGFVWGLAFGTCIWGAATWWMHNAFATMLHLPHISAWAMAALFWLYMGTPYAGLGWAYALLSKYRNPPGSLLCACIFTLLAALRTTLGPGTVHQALAAWPYLIQAADIGGRHLVLFLLVLGNFLLVEALANRAAPLTAAKHLGAFILLLAVLLAYGAWRLDQLRMVEKLADSADFVTVTALQPMIKPHLQASKNGSPDLLVLAQQLVQLTRQAKQDVPAADLVLWPEVPLELPCDCREFEVHGISGAAAAYGAPILLSCTEFIDPAAKYNAAWAVRPDGHCGMAYRKNELVPFGEFMPFESRVRKPGAESGNSSQYVPGQKIRLLQLHSGKRIQPLICYESGFPQLVREGVRRGADLVAVLSDDIWFGSAKAEAMHLDMTLFRAVEVRRPLVSCTNSGIGAHIRATGDIVPGTRTISGVRTATQGSLYCPDVRTIYTRIGENWLWFVALCVGISLYRTWKKTRKHT